MFEISVIPIFVGLLSKEVVGIYRHTKKVSDDAS